MPFRLDEHTAKVQFLTSAETPALVYEACLALGLPSNTVFYQIAVAEKLARDTGADLDQLLANMPSLTSRARCLFDGQRQIVRRTGPTGAVEEARR